MEEMKAAGEAGGNVEEAQNKPNYHDVGQLPCDWEIGRDCGWAPSDSDGTWSVPVILRCYAHDNDWTDEVASDVHVLEVTVELDGAELNDDAWIFLTQDVVS